MREDESFDSFYGKLNEVVIGKFALGEKTEDSKVVKKILRTFPKSFRAKVTAIEESKDLDEIKIQELISFLQTYELSLPSQRKRKSLALKTINERVEAQDSSDEGKVEKEVAYLAKNFRKFLKFKKNGKSFKRENSQISKIIRKTSRRRIPKILLHLKQSRVISAKGMGM